VISVRGWDGLRYRNDARYGDGAAQQLIPADSPPAKLSSFDVAGGGSRLNSGVRRYLAMNPCEQ
jgi:hypothetical protein